MPFINFMLYAFDDITDIISMWLADSVKDLFNYLCEIANLRTTWQALNVPLHVTVERDYGMNARTDGFVLDSYKDDLDRPRHIRLMKRLVSKICSSNGL